MREDPSRARRSGRSRPVGCPQPAHPSERADPGRPAGEGRRRPGRDEQLRLRDLGPDHGARRTCRDDGVALVSGRLLADIARSLPNKPVDITVRRDQDGAGLRHRAVHAADAAGGRLPGAAGDARGHRRDSQRGLRQGRRPGRRRRRTRRAAAGVHRRPDGDRGRHALAAGHRPLPDGAEGTQLEAARQPRRGRRAGAGPRAGRDRQVDDRRRAGDAEPLRRPPPATA